MNKSMIKDQKVMLGVIADDFTGAADAASFLLRNGKRVVLYTCVPEKIDVDCDCIVIALKIRSVEPIEAIKQTKEAVDFFLGIGIKRYYYKFCSTFDSTPKGNIGVVLDFLLEYLNETYTILCPSLPVNGRIVRKGILYVNGVPLSESPMKNHPLNPMWDSFIPTLMKDQSKYSCYVVEKNDLEKDKVNSMMESLKINNERFYLIPDFSCEADGKAIATIFGDLNVMSGGSGLLEYLWPIETYNFKHLNKQIVTDKREVILCGSCSKMTLSQINHYKSMGGVTYSVDSHKLLNGILTAKDVIDFVLDHDSSAVLIYSDAIEKNMSELIKSSTFQLESKLMENLMADISLLALKKGYNRIIVAGGETSGAVTLKLGFTAFYIGDELAPGVPTLIPVEQSNTKLILKSGNFGDIDFFQKAVESD